MPERILLVTDSPEPSGLGTHMATLARALADRGLAPETMWPDHAQGRRLADRVRADGGIAHAVAPVDLARAVADWCAQGGGLVHVHAGIGWEGQELTRAADAAGAAVLRTEHLPWLLTAPDQIAAYRASLAGVDGILCVSRDAARCWRAALAGDAPLHVVPNGIAQPAPAASPRRETPDGAPCPATINDAERHRADASTSDLPRPDLSRPDLSGRAASGADARPGGMPCRPEPAPGTISQETASPEPSAAPDADADPVPGCEEGLILCVGRLTPQKSQRVLLGALARLRARGIAARLWLAGEGPGLEMLRRGIRRLELGDRVRLLGPRGDIPALMARARVLALPSRFEGLPLAVLEAMALGLPVVASRAGGTREALGSDHPWLHPPGDSRTLSHHLERALADGPARDRVVRTQGDRFDRCFTAARMARATHMAYRAARARRDRPPMSRLRLGFIGAGGIAHRHFGVLETMPDIQVVAVCDPDAGRARTAAERMGATPHADHEAMLAAHDLDAVFICVPPFAHGAPERACIARGLPFLVEKPLTLDVDLAVRIAAEVEAAGLVTAVGYHWRYLDTMDEARARLADNPAHLMQGFWIDQTPPPEWWWRADGSGGQVVEQATHIIDAARFLAGDVTEVFGLAARRDRDDFPGLTVPTATAVTLRFASGAVANLSSTCLLRWSHRVGLHVFGDALALEITDRDLMVDVGQGRPVRPAQGDPVWRQDRDFVEAAMGLENRIRCDYAEALLTHQVALAVGRSAETGTLVRLEGLRADPQPTFCLAAEAGAHHAP